MVEIWQLSSLPALVPRPTDPGTLEPKLGLLLSLAGNVCEWRSEWRAGLLAGGSFDGRGDTDSPGMENFGDTHSTVARGLLLLVVSRTLHEQADSKSQRDARPRFPRNGNEGSYSSLRYCYCYVTTFTVVDISFGWFSFSMQGMCVKI